MSEKYTEYLIYLMKKTTDENTSLNLEELRYFNVLEILEMENEIILNDISSSLEENDLNNPNYNEDDLNDPNLEAELDLNINEETQEQKQKEKSKLDISNTNEIQIVENDGKSFLISFKVYKYELN